MQHISQYLGNKKRAILISVIAIHVGLVYATYLWRTVSSFYRNVRVEGVVGAIKAATKKWIQEAILLIRRGIPGVDSVLKAEVS